MWLDLTSSLPQLHRCNFPCWTSVTHQRPIKNAILGNYRMESPYIFTWSINVRHHRTLHENIFFQKTCSSTYLSSETNLVKSRFQSDYKSANINKLEKHGWWMAKADDTCQTVVIYSFFVSIILWVTLYHLRGTTKLLLRSLFFFPPAACHVDWICGKKRWTAKWIFQARHPRRKHPSDGQHCFLFIKKKKSLTPNELFSTWEKDKMCLQEAVGSDGFQRAYSWEK